MKGNSASKCRILLGLFWLLTGGSALPAQSASSLPRQVVAWADLVLYNGKVLTADENFTVDEAVAVRDGKVLATGRSDEILAMAGPRTRRVDLQGRSVVPGFIDTHLHAAFLGNISKSGLAGRIEFKDVKSGLEEIRRIVAAYPAGEQLYIRGPSNYPLLREVTLAQIDEVAPNNPIAITCQNNQVVVNSLMLKKIPADFPGNLKDDQGNLTGQLRGGASGLVLYEMMPWPDVAELTHRQKLEFRRYIEQGLTTIMGRAQGLSITTFRDLMVRGELEPRVRVIHEFLRQNGNPEPYLKRLGNLTGIGNDKLKIVGATVQVVDGSSGSGAGLTDIPKINAVELDAYDRFGQNKWEETGDVSTSDRRNIILGNRYGWTIGGLHSVGDRSNTLLLEAFEEAHRERSLKGRHFGIDHGEMIRDKHIEMIKEMDVVPSVYDRPVSNASNYVEQYGADAVYEMMPLRTLIDAGVKPAAEADTRPPRSNPLFVIRNYITRKDPDGKVWNPDEKITREEALYMYTRWAARYSGEADLLGSLEPGKLADLVVLGGDYMTFPEDDLDKLRVLMTVVGGEVLYEVEGAL